MPAKSVKSFRTAVMGGFHRQDVLEYITAVSREHKAESEAYVAGADRLRAEREALQGQLAAVTEERDTAVLQLARLGELEREMADCAARLEAASAEAERLNRENRAVSSRLSELELDAQLLGDAKQRASELETIAYKRASQIEAEAVQSADATREQVRSGYESLRRRLDALRLDSETAAYAAVCELDKMRDWLAHCTDAFDPLLEQLDALRPADRPVVREFVPEEFPAQ